MNPEENPNINKNISPEDLKNIQEVPLSTDENILNQNNLDNNNIDIDSDNMTNSDINDSKYMPKGTYPQIENQNELIDNNIDINNFIPKSPDQMQMQSQIMNIENDNMLLEQNIEQLEQEHNQLQNQLMDFQKKIETKEGLNNQFKLLPNAFNQRFAEYEKRNELLQKNINELEMQLKNKEIEFQESLKDKNKWEIANKSADIYKQYMNELNNEFKEKTNKLSQKYIEKENNLKNEYVDEINKKMQKIEELRIEHEKLKYDISNYKMNKEALNHQLEEKDYNTNSNIKKKKKEMQYLKEKINEFEQKLEQKKIINKENITEIESQINEIK